jgi:integration host factor subunit beta
LPGWRQRFPQLVAKDADFAVKMILDALTDALARGDRIEIRGFGSFALNYRPPRLGRNPKSGDKVQVPAKYVPHFKARQGVARAGRSAGLTADWRRSMTYMATGGIHCGCRPFLFAG